MALLMPSVSNSSSSSVSSESPFAPEYINKSGDEVSELIGSAKTSAVDQKARLADYINHLYQLREYSKMAAKGSAARGANGMQNPMSVFQSVNEMANQAGIPMDAEIGKALQSGNNIENTLNGFLDSASKIYATLGSIPNRQSKSESISQSNGGGGGGGSGARIGGNGNGGNGGQGTFTDIYGNVRSSANGPITQRNNDIYNPQNFVGGGSDAWNQYTQSMSGQPGQPSQSSPDTSFNPDGSYHWSSLPGLQNFGVDPSHETFSMMDGVAGGNFSGNPNYTGGYADNGGSGWEGMDGGGFTPNNNYSPSNNFDFFNNYTPESSYSPSWQGGSDVSSYPDDFSGAYQPAYNEEE